jgi:hypothetical protein
MLTLSGCYTVIHPDSRFAVRGFNGYAEPRVEVHYNWNSYYPTVHFTPYFYYPVRNRIIYTNYYDFLGYYDYYYSRPSVTVNRSKPNKPVRSRNEIQGRRSRGTETRSANTRTRTTIPTRTTTDKKRTETRSTRSTTRTERPRSTTRTERPRTETRSTTRTERPRTETRSTTRTERTRTESRTSKRTPRRKNNETN